MERKQFLAAQFDEAMTFRMSLETETDRGVALVCAAYIEDQLKVLLERQFANVPKVIGKLFDAVGPLGTFSAKIDIALASGVISDKSHRGLHIIRKIRNKFAHYHLPRSFEETEIAAQCSELVALMPEYHCESNSGRERFINCSTGSVAGIHGMILLARHTPLRKASEKDTPEEQAEWKARIGKIVKELPPEQLERLNDPSTSFAEQRFVLVEAIESYCKEIDRLTHLVSETRASRKR
jgi:hypothetical protein